jgi:hypothetical protein
MNYNTSCISFGILLPLKISNPHKIIHTFYLQTLIITNIAEQIQSIFLPHISGTTIPAYNSYKIELLFSTLFVVKCKLQQNHTRQLPSDHKLQQKYFSNNPHYSDYISKFLSNSRNVKVTREQDKYPGICNVLCSVKLILLLSLYHASPCNIKLNAKAMTLHKRAR